MMSPAARRRAHRRDTSTPPAQGMRSDRQEDERQTADAFTVTAELRWKINRLENEKLEFTRRHNEELSVYEAQVARLRAQVERGEAQRQTLEYEVTVAAAERRTAEKTITDLQEHNQRLEVICAEIRQKALDLQRCLDITQRARDEEQRSLQAELQERESLLMSADADRHVLHTEKSRLHTLLQEQTDTLQELKGELVRMKRERETDAEKLRNKYEELKNNTEREERLRTELESALQKLKVLDQTVESERAAHLESKLSCEVIQVRVRDLEGALTQERSSHAEVQSSLEMMKQKFGDLERSYTHERQKSEHISRTLKQLEQDFSNMKMDLIDQLDQEKTVSAELIGQLDQERVESAQLSVKLQEQEKECTERQQKIKQVQQSYEDLLCDVQQVLSVYEQQGASHTLTAGEGDDQRASALMDNLRTTLHYYSTQLQESVMVCQRLNQEMRVKDELISELQKNMQECEARAVCVNEEVLHLRTCVADAAADADRAQRDLRRLTQQLEDEREQHTHTLTQMNTLQQQHDTDTQEKLLFLHTLYQRLVAGCVLVMPPHSMLGSFSWAELSMMLQERVDVLTSDLTAANQKVLCLESVCESRSAALESVSAQLRRREETWIKQTEELNTHHAHLKNKLEQRIQELSRQLAQAEIRVRAATCAQSEQEEEVKRLQQLVGVCGHEEVCLLAACGVLAGCVRGLRRQACVLAWQKAVLQQRVCAAEALRADVSELLRALRGREEVRGQREVRDQPLRVFRRYVLVVLAAGRLRALGQRSAVLFRVSVGYGQQPHMCVNQLKMSEEDEDEDESSRVMKMLSSSELLVLIHTCMKGVQEELKRSECVKGSSRVLSVVQSCCVQLCERLLSDVDSEFCFHHTRGSLTRQLSHGLHKHTTDIHAKHGNSKVMVASLQQHILEFTRRLHSAEVERRNLRLELSRMKHRDTHRACVPVQRFEGMCEELSSTLQSLSEVKVELKRKDQTISSLRKQLSQSQHRTHSQHNAEQSADPSVRPLEAEVHSGMHHAERKHTLRIH